MFDTYLRTLTVPRFQKVQQQKEEFAFIPILNKNIQPSLAHDESLCRTAGWYDTTTSSEPRNCVKVGVAVPDNPYGLYGRKVALNPNKREPTEPRNCVKVGVAVLGFPSLIILMVSMDVK